MSASTPPPNGGSGHHEGRSLLQLVIVVALIVVLVFLHQWAGTAVVGDLDPTAMLALGFVVLGSYTIGALAEVVRLPHITGYLLAGLFFGPSIAHSLAPHVASFFGFAEPLPPFDRGVLNESVIQQLSLFDTLAVALIAISAGGELKLAAVRQGLRVMLSIIAGQYTLVLISVTGFVVLISGSIPAIALPGLTVDSPFQAIGLGIVVAAVAFAASPAAALAIISETGATGPMSRTVLNTIVFEDVLVIFTFVVGKFLAATLLGTEVEPIGVYLAQHVGGGIGLGVVLGIGVVLYLRFVAKELMIFLVGVVYTATLIANQLHADTLLMFLTLGFIVGNFSKAGEHLIEKVEQLALPTYVVFFTIAGARMHLDQLQQALPFALALCSLRFVSIFIGVRTGARLGGAPPVTVKYGWLGFLAQAGVALALANQIMGMHGESGAALGTMVMGGIAVNELFGPVLFKLAISLAGESRTAVAAKQAEASDGDAAKPPSVRPPMLRSPLDEVALDTARDGERKNPWGAPLASGSVPLDQRVHELELDLHAIVRDVSSGPLREWRADAETYVRSLRREFLRHHRRVAVRARSQREHPAHVAASLRGERAELAERLRDIVSAHASRSAKTPFRPEDLVDALDTIVAALPETITVPYDPLSYVGRGDESLLQSLQRRLLRGKRRALKMVGRPEPTRELGLRELGRFHLSGAAPDRLDALVAGFLAADRRVSDRTRKLFDIIVRGYDALADELEGHAKQPVSAAAPDAGQEARERDESQATQESQETQETKETQETAPPIELDVEARLKALRATVEEALTVALEDVRGIGQDGSQRVALALGAGLKDLKDDTAIYGTYHLPARARATSRVFAKRLRAIEALRADTAASRRACAATFGMLAMELELVGFEARVEGVMADHSQRLEGELQRRVVQKVERVQQALGDALRGFHDALATEQTADALATKVRLLTEEAERAGTEANRVALQLHDELRDESKVAPLLDALTVVASALTNRYEVLETHVGTGEKKPPTALEPVDVAFRELVQARIDAHIGPELRATTDDIARQIQPLLTALQDLERKLAFNTELATGELDVLGEEKVSREVSELLAEMVGAPLERHKAIMDDFALRSGGWPSAFGERLREAVQLELRELRALLTDGELSRSRLREFRRETESRKLRHRAEQLPGALARLNRQVARSVRILAGDERFERWREALGVRGAARVSVLSAQHFAAPTPRADLPIIYKRLFSADTMEAGDVLLGREGEIQQAQEILTRRVPGRLRSVVLVGIDGVGKAAVSNAVVRTGRFKQVRRVTLNAPCDAGLFDEVVRSGSDGQLVVVDGLHWLLSMEPGGFEPLRRFADLVIADAGRHAWLLHADELFFRFACSVAPLSEAFPECILLEPLSPEALRGAVMDRASHSGLGTAFESVDGDTPLEAWLTRSASRWRGPMDHYFHELHVASGGLVRDALRLWLASIRGVQNDELVRVGRVPASPYDALSRLPEDVLLTLFQVMRQGWMHPRVQAHLFGVELAAAQAELTRLTHLGLLEELTDRVFRVEVHLRGALTRVFIEKGWVR